MWRVELKTQLHLALVGPAWGSIRLYFEELYMWIYFAKRFNKTALAALIYGAIYEAKAKKRLH